MSNDGLIKFRCTRGYMYHHNCIGREDISARQGYCCYAETITGAVLDMVDRFPDEVLHGFTLTNTETDRHYSWDIVNGIKPAPDGVLDINPRVQGNLDLLEGDRTIEKFLNIMRKKRFFLRKMKQCY